MTLKYIEIDYNNVKTDTYGYLRYKGKRVHRIVWENHFGEIPPKYEIHHINDNKLDNSIDNLSCVSSEEHHFLHSNFVIVDGKRFRKCPDCNLILHETEDFYTKGNCYNTICKNCCRLRTKKYKYKRIREIEGDSGLRFIPKDGDWNNISQNNRVLITQEEFDMRRSKIFKKNDCLYKECGRCGVTKSLDEMRTNSKTIYKVDNICKQCNNKCQRKKGINK